MHSDEDQVRQALPPALDELVVSAERREELEQDILGRLAPPLKFWGFRARVLLGSSSWYLHCFLRRKVRGESGPDVEVKSLVRK